MGKRLWHWYRRLCGYRVCPCCSEPSCWFETDNPIHPDGPPIFVRWRCDACGRSTEWGFSRLFDDVAKNMGYESAEAFFVSRGMPPLSATGAEGGGDE